MTDEKRCPRSGCYGQFVYVRNVGIFCTGHFFELEPEEQEAIRRTAVPSGSAFAAARRNEILLWDLREEGAGL